MSSRERFKIEIVRKSENKKTKQAAPVASHRVSKTSHSARNKIRPSSPLHSIEKIKQLLPDHTHQLLSDRTHQLVSDRTHTRSASVVFHNVKLARISSHKKRLSGLDEQNEADFYSQHMQSILSLQNVQTNRRSQVLGYQGLEAYTETGMENSSKQAPAATRSCQKAAKQSKEVALDQMKGGSWASRKMKPDKVLEMLGLRCHSITLASERAGKKINQPLIASKLLKPRASLSPRKKAKVNKITTSDFNKSSNRLMSFGLNINPESIYLSKFKNCLDFLFRVNFSNRLYLQLGPKTHQFDKVLFNKLKVYVGPGNNASLVKEVLSRRFWLDVCDLDPSALPQGPETAFFWSTAALPSLHSMQPPTQGSYPFFPIQPSKKTKPELRDQALLNLKILSEKDATRVEDYILSDGHIVPFGCSQPPRLITNHLPYGECLGDKIKLFKTIFHYYKNVKRRDPFGIIPLTYAVRNSEDPQFRRFMRDAESSRQMDKIWIVKPGEGSNRGFGIVLAKTTQVQDHLRSSHCPSYIIQSYLQFPLLYNGRKFDIRHFILITSVNGFIKCYWYQEGYVRTSSEPYSCVDSTLSNRLIHLTNDYVQRQSQGYHRHEPANKVSYQQFHKYLMGIRSPGKVDFLGQIVHGKMKAIVRDVISASYSTLDFERRASNFQIFGLDFMIDRDLNPWLIEVNSNPCLDTNCPILAQIIPHLLESSMRIALDPLAPPPSHFPPKYRNVLPHNYQRHLKMELIFDECSLESTMAPNYDLLGVQEEGV